MGKAFKSPKEPNGSGARRDKYGKFVDLKENTSAAIHRSLAGGSVTAVRLFSTTSIFLCRSHATHCNAAPANGRCVGGAADH